MIIAKRNGQRKIMRKRMTAIVRWCFCRWQFQNIVELVHGTHMVKVVEAKNPIKAAQQYLMMSYSEDFFWSEQLNYRVATGGIASKSKWWVGSNNYTIKESIQLIAIYGDAVLQNTSAYTRNTHSGIGSFHWCLLAQNHEKKRLLNSSITKHFSSIINWCKCWGTPCLSRRPNTLSTSFPGANQGGLPELQSANR